MPLSIAMPPFNEEADIRFTPKTTGFHRLRAHVNAHGFTLRSANVPVAFDTSKAPAWLVKSSGSLFACLQLSETCVKQGNTE